MVVRLSSLKVTADMDSGPYVAGMNAKVAADQRGTASSTTLGAATTSTDTKITSAVSGVERLSRTYVSGYADAAKFEAALRTLGRAFDNGRVSAEQAQRILVGLYERYGAVANATDLAAAGQLELAAAVRTANAAIAANDTALDGNSAALKRNAAAANIAHYNARNLGFQLTDIAQGIPLLFQSPGYGLLNLGNQLAQIGQIFAGNGGLGAAIRETSTLLGGFVLKFAPLVATVGAVAGAVGVLTHEINEGSKAQVNFGNVALAAWQLFAEGVGRLVRPAIEAIGNWFQDMVDWLIPVIKNVGNTIVAVFVGAYHTVVDTWNVLPDAFASLFIKAMNGAIDIVQNGINGIIGPLNALLEKVGMGKIGTSDLSGFKGTPSNADQDVLGIAGRDFGQAFGTDYMGNYYNALSDRAHKLALAHDEASKGADKSNASHQRLAHQGLTEAEKAANDLAKTLEQTLGGALTSLFSGPISSLQDGLDKVLTSFAGLGQQNLGKVFDGLFSAPANDNKLAGGLSAAGGVLPVNVKNSDDISKGFGNLFKNNPALAQGVGAGIGGLGIGYQTQNPLMGAVGGALAGSSAGPWGAVIGGIAGLIGGLLGQAEANEKAKQAVKDNTDAINAFIATGFGDEVSKYTTALAQFTAQGQKLIDLAKQAGDNALVDKLGAAIAAYPATLAKQLTDDLDRQLNTLNGAGYINDIADAQKAYNQTLADGATLGVDVAAKANAILAGSLQKIATDASLTTSQILVLAAQFPALAGSLNSLIGVTGGTTLDQLQQNVDDAKSALNDAYTEQASIYKSTADAARQASKNIRDFIASMDTGSLSPLAPKDQFLAAQAQFAQVSQGALAGNADDVAKLTSVSQDYLDAAKGYYASSEQYFAIFDQVKSILGQTAATQDSVASTADMQLASLNQQVGSLISIDNGVQSVAAAVAALASALGAQAAGPTTGTSTPMGAVDQLYQSVLGRSADASGAAFWQGQISAAGGLNNDITRQFISAAIGNGETVDPTIRAAYGYANGTSFHPGGMAWVGERGPELLNLPRGSQVYPNAASMRMAGAGNDNSALIAEVKELRADVARLTAATAAGAMHVGEQVNEVSATVKDQSTTLKRISEKRVVNG